MGIVHLTGANHFLTFAVLQLSKLATDLIAYYFILKYTSGAFFVWNFAQFAWLLEKLWVGEPQKMPIFICHLEKQKYQTKFY